MELNNFNMEGARVKKVQDHQALCTLVNLKIQGIKEHR
jgi:hypothetical protein